MKVAQNLRKSAIRKSRIISQLETLPWDEKCDLVIEETEEK